MVASAELVVLARNRAEQRRLLPPGEHLLGRSSNCAIVIDCPEASQVHARLRFDGARLRIEDAGSTNGTFVDGTRLQSPVELRPGTRVQIGSTVVIWTGTSTGAQPPTPSNYTAGTAETVPAEGLDPQEASPTAPRKSYHVGREIGRGGMGAVLYTLLALRPPIEASDIVEAIEMIRQRGVLPPGNLNHGGSPALRHCPGRRRMSPRLRRNPGGNSQSNTSPNVGAPKAP